MTILTNKMQEARPARSRLVAEAPAVATDLSKKPEGGGGLDAVRKAFGDLKKTIDELKRDHDYVRDIAVKLDVRLSALEKHRDSFTDNCNELGQAWLRWERRLTAVENDMQHVWRKCQDVERTATPTSGGR